MHNIKLLLKSKVLTVLFTILCVISSAYAAPATSPIDWSSGFIEVIGVGVPANTGNRVQAQQLARRAAMVDAQRNLAEAIQGVQVDGQTTIKDLEVQSDIVKTNVTAFIKNAKVISEQQLADGSYQVVMRAPLYGNDGLQAVIAQISAGKNQTLPQTPVVNNQVPIAQVPVVPNPYPVIVPAPTPVAPVVTNTIVQPQLTGRRAIQDFHWQSKDDNNYDYFMLTLSCPQPTEVREIYFDGNPSSNYYLLYQDTNISPKDGSLGVFNGMTNFKIKRTHNSDWKPGDKINVEVLFADGSCLRQEATYYSNASAPATNYLIDDLVFVDKTQDKVGEGLKGMPNNHPDWHVKLRLNLPNNTEVSRILLFEANKNGDLNSYSSVWDTKNVKYNILGVVNQGQQLNYNHISTIGTFSGITDFDLYANKTGQAKYLLAYVYFKDGSANASLVQTKEF